MARIMIGSIRRGPFLNSSAMWFHHENRSDVLKKSLSILKFTFAYFATNANDTTAVMKKDTPHAPKMPNVPRIARGINSGMRAASTTFCKKKSSDLRSAMNAFDRINTIDCMHANAMKKMPKLKLPSDDDAKPT